MVVASVAKGDLGRSVAHALRDIVQGKPPEAAERLTLRGLAANIPVNAEIGPIGACPVSHYSLIGDIRAYVAAQIAEFKHPNSFV